MKKYRAFINNDGSFCWYQQNYEMHRLNGPARKFSDGSKFWYQYGKFHRLEGKAIEYANGYGLWYIEGAEYNKKEFDAEIARRNQSLREGNLIEYGGKIIEVDGNKYKLIQMKHY